MYAPQVVADAVTLDPGGGSVGGRLPLVTVLHEGCGRHCVRSVDQRGRMEEGMTQTARWVRHHGR